jgi:hypothetical protein
LFVEKTVDRRMNLETARGLNIAILMNCITSVCGCLANSISIDRKNDVRLCVKKFMAQRTKGTLPFVLHLKTVWRKEDPPEASSCHGCLCRVIV